ncbi:MAG: pentapeptide repeat-containing protein, partial [Saprospiraceae bacterium]|nr:pentapeptide repeat-containing protein [Saprospiraceae bacterium]
LVEVDFTEADLQGCSFTECNLDRALFFQSDLRGCDFRTARLLNIDPDQNRLRKARFTLAGTPGLLRKYDLDIEE